MSYKYKPTGGTRGKTLILNYTRAKFLTNPAVQSPAPQLVSVLLEGANGPEKTRRKLGAANCRRAQNKYLSLAAASSPLIGRLRIRRCRSPAPSCHAAQPRVQRQPERAELLGFVPPPTAANPAAGYKERA